MARLPLLAAAFVAGAWASPLAQATVLETVTLSGQPSAAQMAAARRALAAEIAEEESFGGAPAVLAVAETDLDGDSWNDLIVQIQGMMYCGSAGCSGYAILWTGDSYAAKALPLGVNFHERITVLTSARNGMQDLRFDDSPYVFKWNGRHYE